MNSHFGEMCREVLRTKRLNVSYFRHTFQSGVEYQIKRFIFFVGIDNDDAGAAF